MNWQQLEKHLKVQNHQESVLTGNAADTDEMGGATVVAEADGIVWTSCAAVAPPP